MFLTFPFIEQAFTLKFRLLSVKSTSFRFYWKVVEHPPHSHAHGRTHSRAGGPQAKVNTRQFRGGRAGV
jgi:hypothetical protein